MKIAITGGHSEAEFIIAMFKREKNELVVIILMCFLNI